MDSIHESDTRSPGEPRVALVTGASRGLGAAIARRLGGDGHAVAVNYRRSAAAAEAVVARLHAEGAVAQAFQADVTDEREIGRLIAAIEEWRGSVTTLVLNATGPQPAVQLEDLTWADVSEQLAHFVKSPCLLARAVVPGMRRAGGGRIVCIGSDSVQEAAPGTSAYVAAKSAQLGLARVWARELGRHGITVNTVAPGWVPVERHAGEPAERLEQYLSTVPLGRFGDPDDVAAAVAYLASDAATFVSGAYLTVNGASQLP